MVGQLPYRHKQGAPRARESREGLWCRCTEIFPQSWGLGRPWNRACWLAEVKNQSIPKALGLVIQATTVRLSNITVHLQKNSVNTEEHKPRFSFGKDFDVLFHIVVEQVKFSLRFPESEMVRCSNPSTWQARVWILTTTHGSEQVTQLLWSPWELSKPNYQKQLGITVTTHLLGLTWGLISDNAHRGSA